ncbi:hypothetical protein K503DRAFT_774959 [Rhizopogon vinicolor AM-OR11-026]|uniref:Uncharacterized protein n=1 Tax=Rhizopogon vinicolor AM-OR11-026 TaxID=1314800 RepID=A0A1B7MN82_9AGAM|nr:hypothetical protein K503DRAFT_774959 [Rhizopogon vinicolor AM-OR11-026]
MPYLGGFRLRWWSKSHPKPSLTSENDSDRSSSPDRVQRRISLHISVPKNARHSSDRARNSHYSEKALGTPTPIINKTASTSRLSHDEALNEKCSTQHLDRPTEATGKVAALLRSTSNVHKSSPPTMDMRPSLVRRVTSKLRITVPATTSSSQPMLSAARPSYSSAEANDSARPPRSPRAPLHHSPTLPNSFASREKREAALRERGLRPPRKDLSEQEREADERLGLAPVPVPERDEGGSSAASKIKEEWLFMNRSTESEASGPHSAFYPRQLNFGALASGVRPSSHSASESLPRSSSCDSDADLKAEIPFIGRSSMSSSVSPLSQSSHLEVLQEEPAEHGLPTPLPPSPLHSQPPIIISTPVEDSFPPSSPISCTFSSHLAPPGSFSQPHSPLPAPSDKENSYSSFPKPPVRRRMTNASSRSHSSVGTSLSKFGTNSLTNLRRSVIGSIKHSGSSADLSTSSSQPSSPRMAISPTIHNRGSILIEAKGIEDAESRRLSELAFLD